MSTRQVAMTLVHNTPDLVCAMQRQLPGVIVVDNGSDAPVPGGLRVLQNLYFTGGWNTAMAHVDAEWVWMLNSDVTGASHAMFDQLMESSPEADIITPIFERCYHPHMRGKGHAGWVDWVAPVVRRQWFMDTGGFDIVLRGWGADIDICYRGKPRVVIRKDITLGHEWGGTTKRCGDHGMYALDMARHYLKTKHGPAIKHFARSFFQ